MTSFRGEPGISTLRRLADEGQRPRKDYVELARLLDADVVDAEYLEHRAHPFARVVAKKLDLRLGQICEGFLRARRGPIAAFADRLGLPLALLNKLTRSRSDTVLISVRLSVGIKAFMLRRLKVHTHLAAIVNYGSVQMRAASERLGVPESKLHHLKQPVDERFWTPATTSAQGRRVCAVGWEARDYSTLLQAMQTIDGRLEIAVGIAAMSAGPAPRDFKDLSSTFTYPLYRQWMQEVEEQGLPQNVTLRTQIGASDLRAIYRESDLAVIPLHDVDFDAGVTALTEAMAMAKPVVMTRTRGQIDVMTHGDHGLYVPAGDAGALREAIEHLLDNPDEAARMGRAGRSLVEREHRLDDYVERLADIVRRSAAA